MIEKKVYIAKVVGLEDVYKVGFSGDPGKRVEMLKRDYKHDFELMFDWPAIQRVENRAHGFLKPYLYDGLPGREFFKLPYRNILSIVMHCAEPDENEHNNNLVGYVESLMVSEEDWNQDIGGYSIFKRGSHMIISPWGEAPNEDQIKAISRHLEVE